MEPLDALSLVRSLCAKATNNEYSEALSAFKAVLEEFPDSPTLWCLYGDFLSLFGIELDDCNCEAAYKAAISLDPLYSDAYFSLGKMYMLADRHDDAIKYLTISNDLDCSLSSLCALAEVYKECGRNEEAWIAYSSAQKILDSTDSVMQDLHKTLSD